MGLIVRLVLAAGVFLGFALVASNGGSVQAATYRVGHARTATSASAITGKQTNASSTVRTIVTKPKIKCRKGIVRTVKWYGTKVRACIIDGKHISQNQWQWMRGHVMGLRVPRDEISPGWYNAYDLRECPAGPHKHCYWAGWESV